MFEFYVILTGAVTLIGGLWAWRTTRDPFYPAVVITPLFFYFYCVWPLIIERHGELAFLFGPEQLDYVALLYLFSIAALYAGLLQFPRRIGLLRRQRDNMLHLVLAGVRPVDIYALGIFLGFIAIAAYLNSLENVGGFLAAYSRSKGGGYASSGYIGEAILLSFPAIALIAIARRVVNRLRIRDVILVLLIAAPHLIQGTIGGRRGPLFLILLRPALFGKD
ncbi:MAG: hypothetical protein BECKG1743D_GA0114223_107523 [Candidatus Kentron sp. G]|nr:MAG: hypothetical protein BECKG1743E_GA0114224_105905 [Candidatus Kentron sp. G]VFN04952.1 MAG: hypothetical protein BECKG1743F_GA0114225_110043 [Candidatus Kentron sp. G]VFN05668.1 MAG: hypothetical protein BECKG1743D_GA0114223_107523 [Candidatus Kentron sp. G]